MKTLQQFENFIAERDSAASVDHKLGYIVVWEIWTGELSISYVSTLERAQDMVKRACLSSFLSCGVYRRYRSKPAQLVFSRNTKLPMGVKKTSLGFVK